MSEPSIDFLRRMVESVGPSGYEQQTAELWREEASKFADQVETDLHGNVQARINPGEEPRIMIAGHIDEIGFQITNITEDGYLRFTAIGGWDDQIPQGQRVWIRSGSSRVNGVIGKKAAHLLEKEEREDVQEIQDMWIDIGAEDEEEARELVSVGDPVVLSWELEELENDLLVSKSFDNRVGAFTALEILRALQDENLSAEVVSVATVQEEIGLRGAKTATHGVDPDIGVAIDVTHATDYPGVEDTKNQLGEVDMGEGPVIYRGANVNPKLHELLVETGTKKEIPHQIRACPKGTGTDGNAMQLARSGVATAVVSIPNRYMHSPCEVVHWGDLKNVIRLLSSSFQEVREREQFIPY